MVKNLGCVGESITQKGKGPSKKIQKGSVVSSQGSLGLEPSAQTSHKRQNLCCTHQSAIEFLCSQKECLKELCGHCILEHSFHIQHIISITQIMNDFESVFQKVIKNPKKIQQDIKDNQKNNQISLFNFKTAIQSQVDAYLDEISKNLNISYAQQQEMIEEIGNQKKVTPENGIMYFKKYYQYFQQKNSVQSIQLGLNQKLVSKQLEILLNQNLNVNYQNYSLQSSFDDAPKYLHWFEWGKKRVNIYDINLNETHIIELQIGFKIPSFSRSVMIPDGKIFILGGEEPEYFSRREVYLFNPVLNDRKLHQKSREIITKGSMPSKKFDFTICSLGKALYVICGKDSVSEVTDTCERYSIEEDTWTSISSVNIKRYAASACGFRGDRIFLFGGRSETNNLMVSEIEQYSVNANTWTVFNIITGQSLWNPVEVCACLQINHDQIMIFGGSDARIKDQHSSLFLQVAEGTIERKSDLKKAQVFVASPFLYGGYVYAIGNEYYMKNRNLHRFSLNQNDWELIF